MTKEQHKYMMIGLNKARTIILAKVRRMDWTKEDSVTDFIRWIKDMDVRYNKRKGGLGK